MTVGEFKQWLKGHDVADDFDLTTTDDSDYYHTEIHAELFPDDTVALVQGED